MASTGKCHGGGTDKKTLRVLRVVVASLRRRGRAARMVDVEIVASTRESRRFMQNALTHELIVEAIDRVAEMSPLETDGRWLEDLSAGGPAH